ncbi:MAG: cupredoxin domain-containing protein [Gemmatimonadaceae bacterium]
MGSLQAVPRSSRAAPRKTISMKDFAFSPGNVHVPVGAKVTWRDEDNAPHIAAAADGSWSTASLLKGQSATITFDKPGDYLYVAAITLV